MSLKVKKQGQGPAKPPTVFQSKGGGRRSVGNGVAKSGSLSPRSAVFSAGMAPPGHPDKKLMDELNKVREEKDRLHRSVAALKVQLSEKETEIKNMSLTIEQLYVSDIPDEGRQCEAFMDHVQYLQGIPAKAAAATSFDMLTFLQEWNKELLHKISCQALEIADVVTGSKQGKDNLIESLSHQVRNLTSKLLVLSDAKPKAAVKCIVSPSSSPPASPAHVSKRSAVTSYQNSPANVVPAELKRLLAAVPPPESPHDAYTPYLACLRDAAARLHLSPEVGPSAENKEHPKPVNPKAVSTAPPRRSASAERLNPRRGDGFQRTRSLGAKTAEKELATYPPAPVGVGSTNGQTASSPLSRGARLSKATTASSLLKQKHRNSISAEDKAALLKGQGTS
eukprot:TRINITY_DN2378_c1_g1_i1.p1 TRINITY_DN2378_c1_g1~~TRINITY_DN2378_c1_g1_i1.p1  ORF type:complete len:415 (+),score=73.87 TRINITY_DN2378_c1_g1_i1:64-1245(+)